MSYRYNIDLLNQNNYRQLEFKTKSKISSLTDNLLLIPTIKDIIQINFDNIKFRINNHEQKVLLRVLRNLPQEQLTTNQKGTCRW